MNDVAVTTNPSQRPVRRPFWPRDRGHTRAVVLVLLGYGLVRLVSSISLLVREYDGGVLELLRAPSLAAPLRQALRREAYLAFWAIVLAPVVIQWVRWLTRRWARRSLRVVAGHGLGIALVSLAMWSQIVVLSVLIGWDTYPQTGAELWDSFASLMMARIPADALLYGLVAFWTVFRDAEQRYVVEQLHARDLAADLAEARLEALQSRLQPHFLYNTLQTIGAFLEQDAKAARRMLTRLGDLLRATLQETTPLVTLSRELEILDAFLEIQRIRFGERLQIDYRIEPGLEKALVPPLILQPLAENAVRHALDREDRAGRVGVLASSGGDRLLLEVSDNGAGSDTSEFRPGHKRVGGIGLSTTRARLERIFPGAARLDLQRSPGHTVVRIEVPLRIDGLAGSGVGGAS